MSFISHLECSNCSTRHDHRQVQTICTKCGKTLLARYDLKGAGNALQRDSFTVGGNTLWSYRELLPIVDEKNIVSLGEGHTPVRRMARYGELLGLENLWVKDESSNATGSFKARGLSVAVSKAKELGITEACIPTAGNAGSALAAYAAACDMKAHVYLPDDTPQINIDECRTYGADVHLVRGTISDAAKLMSGEKGRNPWFDMSTLKEPYRLEGKKTMGYEVAAQFGWHLPDIIIYPTGGGTGLIGMWKAFQEMEEMGWMDGDRPKMISVQSSGCAPVVRAFESGATTSEFWDDAATIATGLRVPKAFADALILQVLYESRGRAIAVTDEAILTTIRDVAEKEGLLLSPEGAATIAGIPKLLESNVINRATRILVYNTGSSLKYAEVLQMAGALERHQGH